MVVDVDETGAIGIVFIAVKVDDAETGGVVVEEGHDFAEFEEDWLIFAFWTSCGQDYFEFIGVGKRGFWKMA